MTTRTFAAAIVTPIALAALFAAQQHPALYLYYAAVGLILAALSGFAAAHRFRGERDLYRERAELLTRECDAHAAENARLTGVAVQVPLLRVVPNPLPVADEPTPIHDRALIDAWIEDVQAWGEDVDR
jgi:hypothetical protein